MGDATGEKALFLVPTARFLWLTGQPEVPPQLNAVHRREDGGEGGHSNILVPNSIGIYTVR